MLFNQKESMNRKSTIKRKTKETDIILSLNLDGKGASNINIPLGFLTHLLDTFAKHGLFDLKIKAKGDTYVDDHHLTEDIGIALGKAFAVALGNKTGVNRYGFFILPMDETLATVAVDFAGRYAFNFICNFSREKVGDLSTELVYDFWDAFAQNAKANLHIKVENGRNDHHQIEAVFKATARAIRMACSPNKKSIDEIPSAKGVL